MFFSMNCTKLDLFPNSREIIPVKSCEKRILFFVILESSRQCENGLFFVLFVVFVRNGTMLPVVREITPFKTE